MRARPDKVTKQLLRLLGDKRQMKARRAEAERIVLKRMVDDIKDDVVAKAPDGPGILTHYKGALKVVDVTGISGGPAMAIEADVRADLESVDTTHMLATFRVPRRGAYSPAIPILAPYMWVMDMLPPITLDDHMHLREARADEVNAVRELDKTLRPTVDVLLQQAHVHFGTVFVYKGKPQLDLAGAALRAEFGMPGSPKASHWRVPISKARRGIYAEKLSRDKRFVQEVQRTLLDRQYKPSRDAVGPTAEEIDVEKAKDFQGFQDMLL